MQNLIKLNNNADGAMDLEKLIETRLLIQANSGGGKSWCIRRLLEQSHGKIQQIVIDLEGEFSTLREKYDYILAGKDGDTPADPRSAALLARRLLELNVSCIIDLYELNHFDRKHFVKLFLDAMVNAPKELWHPVLVVIDEAHVFCPEHGEAESSSAVIDMATRGRKREFSVVLATQRISKLHKDAAAECNNKLIGRTNLDIDMKRASEELGFTSKEQTLSLRNLEAGEFYAFGPALTRVVTKIEIGAVHTTHKMTSKQRIQTIPPTAKIKALLPKLSDLPAEAQKEAQTVAELKKEVAILKNRRLTLDSGMGVSQWQQHGELFGYWDYFRDKIAGGRTKIEKIEVPMVGKRTLAKLKISESAMRKMLAAIKGGVMVMDLGIRKFSEDLEKVLAKQNNVEVAKVGDTDIKIVKPFIGLIPHLDKTQNEPSDFAGQLKITGGVKAILIGAAQHPGGITREHLTILTGYKRSSRDAYIQRLRNAGLVDVSVNSIMITPAGIQALGDDFKPLPTGQDLQAHLMLTLPEGERKILKIALTAYSANVSRDYLTEATGYQRSSRDAYIQRLKARGLITLQGRGEIRAADKLF